MTTTHIARARSLAAEGHSDDALALLVAAGADGSVDALMETAVWYLSATIIPRDLAQARRYIRRAVEIGHVDGALMEVALAANGNGGTAPSQWRSARELLAVAAKNDPLAKQQLTLLDAMDINQEGRPRSDSASSRLSTAPDVRHFSALLTPAECAHLASVAATLLEPAFVIDPVSGRSAPHPVRTSDGAAIGPTREDLVVRAINARLAHASGTTIDQGEPLTVLRYRPGQQYRPHLDTIAGAKNQRIKTMIVYLNEGFSGGETVFPALGMSIKPRGGDAILFDTVQGDGLPDQKTIHAGTPVLEGAKWIATRWIRAQPVDPWKIASAAA